MKVLLVSQEYPPETGWGGIGTYAGIVAPALARAGAEVDVLSVVHRQARSRSVIDGVTIHRAPLRRPRGVGRLSRLPDAWKRLSLAVAVEREHRRLDLDPDVVECPEWGAEGLVLALRHRLPLVVRLHSAASQVFPYLGPVGVDQRLAIRLEEMAVRRAQIVTGTASQIATIRSHLGLEPSRLRTITYPVRISEAVLAPPGPPRVLFAGRFENRKGPATLVRAAPRVVDAVPGTRFVFLGMDTSSARIPSYRRWLLDLAASLSVAGSVEVVERWGTDAVAAELARSHVCAVPSLWESFGYVAAEAAAVGRPVVASRIPALEEVVEDGVTGRLAAPEDADAWSQALISILTSPGRGAAMGSAGLRRMRQVCHPDLVAALTLEAYEAAIAQFRARYGSNMTGVGRAA